MRDMYNECKQVLRRRLENQITLTDICFSTEKTIKMILLIWSKFSSLMKLKIATLQICC